MNQTSENMNEDDNGASPSRDTDRLNREIALLHDRIKRLEEENASFADMLRERGVKVQASSRIAMELPPPVTTKLPEDSEIFSVLTPEESGLLKQVTSGKDTYWLVRTETKADTGSWFANTRVWAGVTDTDLFMFAGGKKPFFEKVDFSFLRKSIYNHVTGCLVLAPTMELKLSSVRVSPSDGFQILAQIYKGEE